MAVSSIDFESVIRYSVDNCWVKSQSRCAEYVKKAFEAGGCEYVSGNGWNNQKFCEMNGFKCIGDFYPVGGNPRPHDDMSIQFPEGYVQQTGDICLIKHGTYGHMCYAVGPGINEWVSDYWQTYPGQMSGTGPYCYNGNYERVQFWRHSSVMGSTPEVKLDPEQIIEAKIAFDLASEKRDMTNNVKLLSSVSSGRRLKTVNINDSRKEKFRSLINRMVSDSPEMGRDIEVSGEMFDSNILKTGQESKRERK